MLNREELKKTYIKYSEDITEEMFNQMLKIVKRYNYLGEPYDYFTNDYENFVEKGCFWIANDYYAYGVDNNSQDHKKVSIYDIIGPSKKIPMESLLEEAKKRYPVGTVIKSLVDNNQYTIKNDLAILKSYIICKNTCTLYYEKGWAEILKPAKLVLGKFDIGDIVVSLSVIGNYRKEGDLFKVQEKSTSSVLFYCNLYSSTPKDWRLATIEEVQAYNNGIKNINDIKPVQKSLEGRYLKALIDKPHGAGYYKKNGYILIKEDLNGSVFCDKGMYFGNGKYDWEKSNVELMPEGFNPENNIDIQYKVGDYVLTSDNAGGWGTHPDEINNKILKIKSLSYDRVEFESKEGKLITHIKEIVSKATWNEVNDTISFPATPVEWYIPKSFPTHYYGVDTFDIVKNVPKDIRKVKRLPVRTIKVYK